MSESNSNLDDKSKQSKSILDEKKEEIDKKQESLGSDNSYLTKRNDGNKIYYFSGDSFQLIQVNNDFKSSNKDKSLGSIPLNKKTSKKIRM